jgi:hypothetical protein
MDSLPGPPVALDRAPDALPIEREMEELRKDRTSNLPRLILASVLVAIVKFALGD